MRKLKKCDNNGDPTIICKVSPYVYISWGALVVIFTIAVVIVAVRYDLLLLLIIPIVFAIFGGIYCTFIIKYTVLTFKEGKLTIRKGIISSHIEEIPAVNILSIGVEKGMISRIFHYGNIVFATAIKEYRFEKMDKPDRFISEGSKYLVGITRKK